ncbi:MAG: phytoene/squalene synthase family protein [Bacteroidales bacterium]|nr:phytoene/squalene synthase family protein [Bacteroidales bacterium]
MKELFDKVSEKTSVLTTRTYSTSFSLGIFFLGRKLRMPIYSIYGFVRLGDEIVDSFQNYNKVKLLNDFKRDVYDAIDNKISLNPILNSFQHTVHKYNIDMELIDMFIRSMEMDLDKNSYDSDKYKKYIFGSAEVVGLMCLKVFCETNENQYNTLKPYAMSLGAAFQKINFLRDINADYFGLGRLYFPDIQINQFSDMEKEKIEEDIERDFKKGLEGIKKLPKSARFGVYLSFRYYYGLFKKIKKTPLAVILQKRVRISDEKKYYLLVRSVMKYSLGLF